MFVLQPTKEGVALPGLFLFLAEKSGQFNVQALLLFYVEHVYEGFGCLEKPRGLQG